MVKKKKHLDHLDHKTTWHSVDDIIIIIIIYFSILSIYTYLYPRAKKKFFF